MKQKINRSPAAQTPIEFTRADPKQLARFDPRTKVCTMNCGPHRHDPRDETERKFLCDDCICHLPDLNLESTENLTRGATA